MKTILRMAVDVEYKMPNMPNFLVPNKAESGDAVEQCSIHIKTLTREQAEFLAEAMRKEFISHWASFQTKDK